MSIVCLPRFRAKAQLLVAEAVASTVGHVVVDGQKAHGIGSMLGEIRNRAAIHATVSGRHGRLVCFTGGNFADWGAGRESTMPGFVTGPGDFSANGVDPGSAALAALLPAALPGRVADLGAGWGYLSRAILQRDGVEELHLVEAERATLDRARYNITDSRARFHWADVARFTSAAPFDAIVTNPPFHSGRAADPSIGLDFIDASARLLKGSGTLWLVANRHLPYEGRLRQRFRGVREAGGGRRYKILVAERPAAAMPPTAT